MKKTILIICLIFIQFGFSQTDSLTYYNNNGEYEKAIKFGKRKVQNNVNKDVDYIISIKNLAEACINAEKFDLAEKYYLELSKLLISSLGEEDELVAKCYNDLASLYYRLAEYQKAESLFLDSLRLMKNIFGENHPDYAKALEGLALLYNNQGAYQKAEPLFLKCFEIRKKVLGKNHPDYIASLNNLAFFYYSKGDYQKAVPLYLQVIEITKKSSENHINYATSLNNLATLYNDQGNSQKAEPLYLKAIEIRKKNSGENHTDYANSLNNLAIFYNEQGAYQKAESLCLQALEIYKKVLGENHPDYATSLDNLASLYDNQGKYLKAEPFYLKALETRKRVLGENHPDYSVSLNNLASLYTRQEAYHKAELLFLKSLEIRKITIGEIHPNYATSLNNLASLYEDQGAYQKAEPMYLQALEIRKKVLGENHTDYVTSLYKLALLYQEFNPNSNKDKVAEYFQLVFPSFQHQIIEVSTYLSETQLRFYRLNKFSERFLSQSFLFNYPSKFPEINIGCYENELLLKNLSLRNQQRIKNSIEKSNDVILKEKYQQFVANKRYLTKLEELPLAQRPTDFESLKTETENLEKDITRQSATFADAKKTLSISWKQIQEKLLPNDVVIDLVSYHYYNKKWTDSIMYGAFVIKKDSKFPKYINLFEEKQLAALLERNTMAADTIQAKILNKQYSDKAISDLFLKPLEKEFNGCKTIYLSPSGLGHQINFKALPISENQTLGEQFNIKLVGSSASIVSYKTTAFQENKSLEINLYGGIDYAKSSVTSPTNKTNEVAVRSDFGGGFSYLKGTLAEITNIANQVKTNKYNAILKTERNATEESIKLLDGKKEPFVLHLATHGFFFPNPKQELPKEDLLSESKFKIYKTADDPMMRSGLLFAGANKYWGKPTENLTTDDGILTASEISNLDLSACQLVVMSACETGLGQINGSEGVFGLQRAFKMAGVKNIIMSLWKVPDAQTAELFDIFYTECFSGKTIPEAFQIAQSKMKIKYSPYYWAGFMLLE